MKIIVKNINKEKNDKYTNIIGLFKKTLAIEKIHINSYKMFFRTKGQKRNIYKWQERWKHKHFYRANLKKNKHAFI